MFRTARFGQILVLVLALLAMGTGIWFLAGPVAVDVGVTNGGVPPAGKNVIPAGDDAETGSSGEKPPASKGEQSPGEGTAPVPGSDGGNNFGQGTPPAARSGDGEASGVARGGTPAANNNQQQAGAQPPPGQNNPVPSFNQYVLGIVNTYQGKNYPYLLNNDYANYNGVTTTLEYQGRVLARAHPSGSRASHCAGITFEVFFRAMQQWNKDLGLCPGDFNGMTSNELFDFLLMWYKGTGNRADNIDTALVKYGLGRRLHNLEEARPGDFIQFSRENNTGHVAVFIDWLRDSRGSIIGFHYWSSQQSTGGLGYRKEYFNVKNGQGEKYGKVMKNNVCLARVQPYM